MDNKKINDVTDECSKKFIELIEKDETVSYMIIAIQHKEIDDSYKFQTKCAMGGFPGSIAAGILSALDKSPQGPLITEALKKLVNISTKIDVTCDTNDD